MRKELPARLKARSVATGALPFQMVRRHYSMILVVVGVILLAYVGAEYGQMYWAQRDLQRRWAAQQTMSIDQPKSAELKVDDGLMRLSIPKIDLAAVVVEGTSHRSLLLGPGHIKETPAPGQVGNSVITGHRDTFFRHIYELQKGDEILVQRSGKTFKYEVTSKRIVQPDDVSVLKPSQDSRLTLITCYPTYYIGPAPERLIVTSRLLEDPANSDASVQKTSTAVAH
jgi:LPXTG-site transpeptidase (sortase) family protein